ncbi:cation transporter [Paenibacillus qinlingensis]|uniref:cation transporter n=1 Tax=Paenibacillus qinlingensis TaxID=1837343 RepID=UPI0015655CB5|nr:cation transporter [Paenibacillus qinlingensis]NQX60580.1 cation transporter [Paenibacillus qinlingensis]
MKETTVIVKGMSCGSCVPKIEVAIKDIGAEGHVNLEQGTVDVRFDETKIQISAIEEAIKNRGYNVGS